MEDSPTVQKISQSVFDENGKINMIISVLDRLGNKIAGVASDVIDVIIFSVDEIKPRIDKSLNREYNLLKNYKPKQQLNPNYGKPYGYPSADGKYWIQDGKKYPR